jgi:ABC-2 type transport system ATP-binding protein
VATADRERLTVSGLPAERIVALLVERDLPFTEISEHRASLEEAYMELTRDAADYRAGTEAAG